MKKFINAAILSISLILAIGGEALAITVEEHLANGNHIIVDRCWTVQLNDKEQLITDEEELEKFVNPSPIEKVWVRLNTESWAYHSSPKEALFSAWKKAYPGSHPESDISPALVTFLEATTQKSHWVHILRNQMNSDKIYFASGPIHSSKDSSESWHVETGNSIGDILKQIKSN